MPGRRKVTFTGGEIFMSRSTKSLRAVVVATVLIAIATIAAAGTFGSFNIFMSPSAAASEASRAAGTVPEAPSALLYDNGGLATGATTESGVAAPAGSQWSEVQHNAGNLTEANTSAGFSC